MYNAKRVTYTTKKQQELIKFLNDNSVEDIDAIKTMMPWEIATKLQHSSDLVRRNAIKLSTLHRNATAAAKKRMNEANRIEKLKQDVQKAITYQDSLDIIINDLIKEEDSAWVTINELLKDAVIISGHNPEQVYASPIINQLNEKRNPGIYFKCIITNAIVDTIYFKHDDTPSNT